MVSSTLPSARIEDAPQSFMSPSPSSATTSTPNDASTCERKADTRDSNDGSDQIIPSMSETRAVVAIPGSDAVEKHPIGHDSVSPISSAETIIQALRQCCSEVAEAAARHRDGDRRRIPDIRAEWKALADAVTAYVRSR